MAEQSPNPCGESGVTVIFAEELAERPEAGGGERRITDQAATYASVTHREHDEPARGEAEQVDPPPSESGVYELIEGRSKGFDRWLRERRGPHARQVGEGDVCARKIFDQAFQLVSRRERTANNEQQRLSSVERRESAAQWNDPMVGPDL
jgi:hypothetical protein